MGSYLSEPVTEKSSSDECNDKLICGASSMQGWRVSQEDAHNCILDFDENTSYFAVYDGHGGHEVAQYCSQKLPEFIRQTKAYKEGDIEKALVEGFLGFDKLIATREVVAELLEIAGEKEAAEESDYEENVDNLYEEATMPIEKVIEKYTSMINPAVKNLKKSENDKSPNSPYLNAKRADRGECSKKEKSTSNSCDPNDKLSSSQECDTIEACAAETDTQASENSCNGDKDDKENPLVKPDSKDGEVNGSVPTITVESATPEKRETKADSKESESLPVQNGNVESDNKEPAVVKGKGKALAKTKGVKIPTPSRTRPKRTSTELYKTFLDFGEDSEDTEDEEDKTFEGPNDESEDDEAVNESIDGEVSDESSGEEEEVEEEDDEQEFGDDDEDLEFARNMKEEPGSDSGCTAVVALLKENELFVANAGDSRCIVCRNGTAVDMSFDHKPEDELEKDRIIKAGGKVTADGRVNGGLNLSRAIGDHAYKQNKELSDREQMITALPDVKTLTINPAEDEFMVLACDGIWNFMSSQEVVDFVRPRLQEHPERVSTICEEMFDHCLAPNTMGDGTGCDNMTAIIVQFKTNIRKRAASPDSSESSDTSKRAKTEELKSSEGV